jgi:hypothetical protein
MKLLLLPIRLKLSLNKESLRCWDIKVKKSLINLMMLLQMLLRLVLLQLVVVPLVQINLKMMPLKRSWIIKWISKQLFLEMVQK